MEKCNCYFRVRAFMLFKLKKSFAYCARNYVVIFIRFSSEISFVSAASSSSEVAGHLVCTEDCVCVCVSGN